MILAWVLFIGIPLGLIVLIDAIIKMKSGIAIFILLIPYTAIGGNILFFSTSVYNPNAQYYLYGFFFTIPISICSIVVGTIASVAKGAIKK